MDDRIIYPLPIYLSCLTHVSFIRSTARMYEPATCAIAFHPRDADPATLLALITIFVVWVIDMVLFGIARQQYRNGFTSAQYGNANWLTLGAFIALLLGFCTSACGVFGRYRRRRDVSY